MRVERVASMRDARDYRRSVWIGMLEPLAGTRSSTVIRPQVTVANGREVGLWRSLSLEGVPARRKLALGPQVARAEVERSLLLDLSAITAHSFGKLLYAPSHGSPREE